MSIPEHVRKMNDGGQVCPSCGYAFGGEVDRPDFAGALKNVNWGDSIPAGPVEKKSPPQQPLKPRKP